MTQSCVVSEAALPVPHPISEVPLELLELIAANDLSLRDRVALTSCCKALLARADVGASEALWADVEVQGECLNHLPAWLARRSAAVRRLRLLSLQPLCPSVAAGVASLSALRHLDLSGCRLARLPPQMTALGGSLIHLDLSHNALGSGLDSSAGEGCNRAFAPLAGLRAVTCLSLAANRLPRLPPELAALGGALRRLDLSCNEFRLEPCAFAPLAALGALTALDLSCCRRLEAVPWELAQLPQLAELDLSGHSVDAEEGGSEALCPLGALPALRRLAISRGTVPKRRLPPPLPALAARGLVEWQY